MYVYKDFYALNIVLINAYYLDIASGGFYIMYVYIDLLLRTMYYNRLATAALFFQSCF